jgi:hypothetical protein
MPEPDYVLSRRWGTFRLSPPSQSPCQSPSVPARVLVRPKLDEELLLRVVFGRE